MLFITITYLYHYCKVFLQKFTCFQDFNLTFVEYLTHVLSNYMT